MDDLISRKALLEELDNAAKIKDCDSATWYIPRFVREVIVEAPAVEAEQKRGRWKKVYTCHGEQAWGYECDQCKGDNPRASYFCPNCGADMSEEVNDA